MVEKCSINRTQLMKYNWVGLRIKVDKLIKNKK